MILVTDYQLTNEIDVVNPVVDYESSGNEGLGISKLNKLVNISEEPGNCATEVSSNEEWRNQFAREIEKMCAPYEKNSLKKVHLLFTLQY